MSVKKSRSLLLAITFVVVICALMFFNCETVSAVSANPEYQYAVQPDGSKIKYKTVGDEYFHYYVNAYGNVIQKDPGTKYWRQVTYKNGTLSFGNRSGRKAASLQPSNQLKASAFKSSSVKKAYYSLAGESYSSTLSESHNSLITLKSLKKTNRSKFYTKSSNTTTAIPLLTIVIGFNDQKYLDDYDWSSALFTSEYSVGKYYSAVSGGQFTFVPCDETSQYGTGGNTNTKDKIDDGIIHVNIDMNHDNWGNLNSPKRYKTLTSAFNKAIKEADQYVDFSKFDKNGDGQLEPQELSTYYIVAGYEASYGGATTNNVTWAHQSDYDTDIDADGIQLSSYIAAGEQWKYPYSTDPDVVSGIPSHTPVVCHELGHILGLPDLYDINYSESGEWYDYNVLDMSVMCHGSWGYTAEGAPGYSKESSVIGSVPVYMDPYCRMLLGYIHPETITKSGDYTVSTIDSSSGYKAYIIPTENENEYFIVENRQYEGFDVGMEGSYYSDTTAGIHNSTGGIVLWHVDNGIAETRGIGSNADEVLQNTVNTVDHRPGVMPAYYEDSTYKTTLPVYKYPFYNSDATSRYSEFAFNTMLYNGNKKSNRTDSGITVTSSSTNSNSMSVKVEIGLASPRGVSAKAVGNTKMKISWKAVSGAENYMIAREEPDTSINKIADVPAADLDNGIGTYVDTGLTPGKEYTYAVVAVSGDVTSSETLDIAFSGTTGISAPSGVKAKALSKSKIKLTWKSVSGSEGYNIYRAKSKSGKYSLVVQVAETHATDSGLKSGKTYYYKIKTIGADKNSAYSKKVYAVTKK